jgi:hypothetical protein
MSYPSYQEMVNAKRRRNADVLARSGLLEARSALSEDVLINKPEKKKRCITFKNPISVVPDGHKRRNTVRKWCVSIR